MEEFLIECISFGFKHSEEIDADFVFDLRCLPNPFYVEELRDKTGCQKEVREFIMQSKDSEEYLKRLVNFIDFAVSLYKKQGKTPLKIAFGCTGGQHRSVAFAELIFEYLKSKGFNACVLHRDINKR